MAADPGGWLTEIRGRPVVAADGTRLGRVVDLALGPGDDRPSVTEVHFRRRGGPLLRVPWSDVAALAPDAVRLRAASRAEPARTTGPLLGRDVLDAQIVDIAGRRVRRVSDVRLRQADGELQVVGVDTGWRTLLRRLGLWRGTPPARARLDWSDVHLVPAAEHPAELGAPREVLDRLTPTGLSELVARLPPEHGAAVLEAVSPDDAASALSRVRPKLGGRMMASIQEEPAGEILAALPVDDAVAALRHVESGRGAALLDRIPTGRAAELRRLLALPPHSAGGLMTTDVRTARDDEPAAAVRARLAADPPRLEGLTTVFLHDASGRYTGALTPVALLAGSPARRLPPLSVDTPLDDVIDLFAVEDVLALPVLDPEGRIVGAVAIDDVLEELLAERLPHHRRRYRRARVRERALA